jgi:hypothetical protein
MNPNATFTLTINYRGAIGGARFVITRRRKLDRGTTPTGPTVSNDVRHAEVFYDNMSYSTVVIDPTTHETRYVCNVVVPHRVIRNLRRRCDADLSPGSTTRKNTLCMCFIVTNTDGEIIAKVSKLLVD